ncbi:putative RNA ligase [Ralstonia phage RP31]|uniref:Putative RNA ligase n=2 Tax=Ripduovirus RP12 TaxID=2560700 RepID=A0A1L7N129_9CAUD|nr:RNA ligase [Ralstonia phage RP12]BAW19183.1 putative RNA ligase [Ralstonia phage RP12]BAW19469.1 putative RNA ligase [Ralstonia phage RP31]
MLVKEETRKLARIVRVDDVRPIPKADRLEVAVVEGWECVIAKGSFAKGDIGLYLEIDAAIALDNPVLASFDKQYLKVTKDEATGKDWTVVKTVRLRGQLSQGLLLPASYIPATIPNKSDVGLNVTNMIDVLKYVSPQEAKLYQLESESAPADASTTRKLIWKLCAWLKKGIVADGLQAWPAGHVKSDEERVQNQSALYNQMVAEDQDVEASFKLDGESATFYTDLDTGAIGVAQRNWSLRTDDVPYTRKESWRVYAADWVRYIARKLAGGRCAVPQWKRGYIAQSVPLVAFFKRNAIDTKLASFNRANTFDFMNGAVLAIQGEMVGPDFNGNAERLKHNQFYVYRAYANGNRRLLPEQTKLVTEALGLQYIPLEAERMKLPPDMKELLKMADGKAFGDPNGIREGLVIKSHVTGQSVKVISNKWLEKKGK